MDETTTALDAAANLDAPFEGCELRPYQDPSGIWTIGYGATLDAEGRPVTASTPPITAAQALALFERDLRGSLTTVQQDVTVPLTADEEAALTSFVYNVGAGNFARSTLLACLNRGDFGAAASQFDLWTKDASGQVLAGLVRRRAAEQKLFLASQPSSSSTPAAAGDASTPAAAGVGIGNLGTDLQKLRSDVAAQGIPVPPFQGEAMKSVLARILARVRQPSTLVALGLLLGAGVYWVTRSPELALASAALIPGAVDDHTRTILARVEAVEDAVRAAPK